MDKRTSDQRIADWSTAEDSTVQNFVIMNDKFTEENCQLVMEMPSSDCVILPENTDIFDILVAAKFVPNKAQAKNSWTKSDKEIESGLSTWTYGKAKKKFHIWKPI